MSSLYQGSSRNPLAETLARSPLYLDYQRAFTRGTGLPLALHEPDQFRLVKFGKRLQAPVCVLMARTRKACAACYALQRRLERETRRDSLTLKCFAGLSESTLPVRVGESVVAFLHTGLVLLQPPTRTHFDRVAETLHHWRAGVDLPSLEEAYFQTRVLRPAQYQSLLQLLRIFAKQLAACGNDLLLQAPAKEPVVVAKARAFLEAHYTEDLSQRQVARGINSGAAYFSRCFKQSTGLSFVNYLGRIRVERAKPLLTNPALRISQIAFDVGFQSVSQFNRTFKRITGQSPKTFRTRP